MEVLELRSLREPLLPTHRDGMRVEVITRSFAFMEYRKMRRSLFGLYPEKGRVTLFWGLAYSAVLCTLMSLEHAGWQPVRGLRLRWDLDDVCFGGLLTLVCYSTLPNPNPNPTLSPSPNPIPSPTKVMLLTATKTVDLIRFCLYWAYVAMMVLLLTDGLRVVGATRDAPGSDGARGDGATATAAATAAATATAAADAADADAADAASAADADADEASLPRWSSHALRRGLLCALVAAESLTLATWYLIHHVMPAAVLALVSRADLRLWWHIEALAPEAGGGGGGGVEDGGGR